MDGKNDDSDYFGYEGAHRLTGIRKGTLYALVAEKRIPHKRLGPRHVLFNGPELLAWLEQHSVPPQGQSASDDEARSRDTLRTVQSKN